jgi:hypothetical protein
MLRYLRMGERDFSKMPDIVQKRLETGALAKG